MKCAPQITAGAAAAAFVAACSLPVVGHLLPGFVPAAVPRWPAEPVARLPPLMRSGCTARGELTSSSAIALAVVSLAGGVALAVTRQQQTCRKCSEEAAAAEWTGAEGFSSLTKGVPLITDNVAIRKVLPHRYPFLLVDKIIEFEPGKRAVGVKNITANEPQFTGHFPDLPIMPGVLMVEAMAQLGGIVALQPPVSDGKGQFFFAGIDGVKFRKPVVPGDTLVMEMELTKFREKFGIAKFTGKAYTDGDLAVEVKEFTFALIKET